MKILVPAPYNTLARELLGTGLGEVVYKPWNENGRAYNEGEINRLFQKNSANALIIEHDEVSEKVIAANPGLEFIGVCRGTPSIIVMEACLSFSVWRKDLSASLR